MKFFGCKFVLKFYSVKKFCCVVGCIKVVNVVLMFMCGGICLQVVMFCYYFIDVYFGVNGVFFIQLVCNGDCIEIKLFCG